MKPFFALPEYKKETTCFILFANTNLSLYFDQTPIFTKQDTEVEGLLEVYLTDLLSDGNLTSKKVKTSYGAEVEVPAFNLSNHLVWGATAMMLSEVKDLLKATL